MEVLEYIWMDGKLVPWSQAQVHVLTHTLHYGAGVFEGIRLYETEKGPAVFRLKDHIERLFYSAGVYGMEIPYSPEEIFQAVLLTVRENGLKQGYIRPIFFYGYGKMGLSTIGAPINIVIAAWPWGKYLSHDLVSVKTSQVMRIHPKTTDHRAKVCGNYANSILASQEAHNAGYDEALLLDYQEHVAEGPGENFFMVKDGVLITPEEGSILPGITRASLLKLAQDLGIPVAEKLFDLDEVYQADEAFFTGTAAEVTPIGKLDDRTIGVGKVGPVTLRLKQAYEDVIYGRNDNYHAWLAYV